MNQQQQVYLLQKYLFDEDFEERESSTKQDITHITKTVFSSETTALDYLLVSFGSYIDSLKSCLDAESKKKDLWKQLSKDILKGRSKEQVVDSISNSLSDIKRAVLEDNKISCLSSFNSSLEKLKNKLQKEIDAETNIDSLTFFDFLHFLCWFADNEEEDTETKKTLAFFDTQASWSSRGTVDNRYLDVYFFSLEEVKVDQF